MSICGSSSMLWFKTESFEGAKRNRSLHVRNASTLVYSLIESLLASKTESESIDPETKLHDSFLNFKKRSNGMI